MPDLEKDEIKIDLSPHSKKKIISSLITINYFWINEGNFNMSLVCYNAIKNLPLSKKQKTKLQELKDCINSEFGSKNVKNTTSVLLYNKELSEDENIACIAASFILNLFAAKTFDIAFEFFFHIGMYSPFIASQVMLTLKKENDIKDDLVSYLGSYILFYAELTDTDIKKGIDLDFLLEDDEEDCDDDIDEML